MFSNINRNLLTNALSFQIVWFICVQGNSLHAALATLFLLILHALIFKPNVKGSLFLLAFSVIGFTGDSLIALTVDLSYASQHHVHEMPLVTPVWLLCLWIAFSTTMNHSMKWLFKSPYIAFLIGLLLVPISYIAGIKLSNSTLLAPYWQFILLEGLWWALLLVVYQLLVSKKASFKDSSTYSVPNEINHD